MCEYFIDSANNLPPKVVEQYFKERDQWNKIRNKAPEFHGYKDRFDDISHIIIATDGIQCFGGVRATISYHGSQLLPMEQHGLRLKTMYPEFDLENSNYVEFSKFVVCQNSQALQFNNLVMYRLIQFSINHIQEAGGIQYLFCWGGKKHLRIYQIMGRFFNVKASVRSVDLQYVPECCYPMGEIFLHGYPLHYSTKSFVQTLKAYQT